MSSFSMNENMTGIHVLAEDILAPWAQNISAQGGNGCALYSASFLFDRGGWVDNPP